MRKIAALLLCGLLGVGSLPQTSDAARLSAVGDGMVRREIASGGLTRSYHLYAPPGISKPAPLVIMLHGGGGNGKNGAMMSGLNAAAAREGFLVIYPDGTSRRGPFKTWNGGHCCAYAMQENIDDVGFISALIDSLVAEGSVDPKRVYATGMSNGAIMAHRLGRELPEKIAAIAPVVGAVFGDEQPAARPVSAMIVTGMLDENVPPAGGYGVSPRQRNDPNDRSYAPAAAQAAYWAATNGCPKAKTETEKTAAYTLTTYTGCKEGSEVLWYNLTEGTHSWPGGRPGHRGGDEPSKGLATNDVMWAFFERHDRK